MAEHSSIEWTDATWNPITGCSVVSPGCTNCYAMGLAGTRLRHHASRAGLTRETKAGPVWTGDVRLNEAWLTQPLEWFKPKRIFVCAHGDLFAENVPDEWIDRVFAVMSLAPHHTFQVLTKRPARMRAYLADLDRSREMAIDEWRDRIGLAFMTDPLMRRLDGRGLHYNGGEAEYRVQAIECATVGQYGSWPRNHFGACQPALPLRNVWLGVSAEDQRRADERVPDLLATPAAVRFVSAEPLLGAIDFTTLRGPPIDLPEAPRRAHWIDALTGRHGSWFTSTIKAGSENFGGIRYGSLDWIIVGGESGTAARPMHPQWARDIRDACAEAGTAFHFKQHGAWAPTGEWYADHPVSLPLRAWTGSEWTDDPGFSPDLEWVARVGKKAAGRLLDGIEHNGLPAVAVR